MFNVSGVTARLSNLTAYSERHGEDHVSGLALKLEMTMQSAILDTLNPKLRAGSYNADGSLVIPEIESFAWRRDLIGARVLIGYEDLFNSDPVELESTTVDKLRIAMKNDDIVDLTIRVKCKPDAMGVGRLYDWLQKDVLLTIEPPKAAADTADQPDDASGSLPGV